MSSKKNVIIFDMDGTLVDSSSTIVNAINYVRQHLELPPLEREDILTSINRPDINPADYFYNTENFTPEHETWFSEYYTNNHEKELQLYDGIDDLLKGLKDKGYTLALATNAYRGSTLESLSHLNILDYFSSIACYDDVDKGKPAPDMLKKNLKELNVQTEETLFIGDSERDMMASEEANIDYIMINWGFSDYTDAIHSVALLEKKILEF